MKVEIEKYKAKKSGFISALCLKGFPYTFEVRKNYNYYIFMSEEKAWIRHSGKLTKGEKQWVIESENKKHICPEASHIECSCKDKCLRNINNYK